MPYEACQHEHPKISVITPSLNHARYLKATICSIEAQTFRNYEHIVVDGGSSDGTIEILKQYPHIRWISEVDNNILEAYQKALNLARGDYIIQCCVSDGFLDSNWFQKCVDLLDTDINISLVWALPQFLSEDGALLDVIHRELLTDPPPQLHEFISMWLATGIALPEANYCVRANIIKSYFPNIHSSQHFQIQCHLGFVYEFMVRGYAPYFLPMVANFTRIHENQRNKRLLSIEKPAARLYLASVSNYKNRVLTGLTTHYFLNGRSEIVGKIRTSELFVFRLKILRHTLLRSKLCRTDFYTLMIKALNIISSSLSSLTAVLK